MFSFDSQMFIPKNATPAVRVRDNFKITSHQYGWEVALKALSVLYHPEGLLLDAFVEKTFLWDIEANRAKRRVPYKDFLIGFIHHPPGIPTWPALPHHRFQGLDAPPQWGQNLAPCLERLAF